MLLSFFFFNDTATTEIYPLSLHDALPISVQAWAEQEDASLKTVTAAHPAELISRIRDALDLAPDLIICAGNDLVDSLALVTADRKSTRLNSSHQIISYAVFCLKKKTISKA